MQDSKNVIQCYNQTAANYAAVFIDELTKKHLDKILLNSFAQENSGKGKLVDFGCGPGQTTKYLSDRGITDILGVDLSPAMVTIARQLNPALQFETADMLDLKYPDESFASAIAFYSIVHFDYEQLKVAFKEIRRVLLQHAQLLFSFHVGDKIVHLDNFLEHPVNIDFYFFDTDKVLDLVKETGFEMIDVIERQPYPGVEHPSKRAYIWMQKG